MSRPLFTPRRRVAPVALLALAALAAACVGGPRQWAGTGALNPAAESRVPRPLRCRTVTGAVPWDTTANSWLAAIIRDSSAAPRVRAARVREAWPELATFEALEARACALLATDRVHNADYESFVDRVVPELLASVPAPSADSLFRLQQPRLRDPAPGAVFSRYPRRTTVSWDSVPGADHYLVEVYALVPVYRRPVGGGDPVFEHAEWAPHGGGLHSARVRRTEAVFYFGGAQPGRWRVRAISARGVASRPSEWREFTHTR